MNSRVAIILVGLFWLSAPAFGHRLNEYLQASTIELTKDHLVLQLHLTAGEDVARKVLAGIDNNGDGILSGDEQKAYVDMVRQDLSLTIDGSIAALQTDSFSFPSIAAINKGIGDIVIRYEATMPSGKAVHKLTFENHH